MPVTRGKSVDLRMHVDTDHAREKETHCSRNGLLIFMNTYLIQWMSKKNLRLRHQFLVQMFWRWIIKWKHSVGSNTSWGWWGFILKYYHTSMVTTCWLYKPPKNQILIWGKRLTKSANMIRERASRWVSRWWLTSQQMIIVQTCWRNILCRNKRRYHTRNLLNNKYDDNIL